MCVDEVVMFILACTIVSHHCLSFFGPLYRG